MHIEIILNFANFAATTTNNHADFFRINVNFARCARRIEVVVGSWCGAAIIEIHSWLTFTIVLSTGTILAKATLIITVAVCIVAWTLSYIKNKCPMIYTYRVIKIKCVMHVFHRK